MPLRGCECLPRKWCTSEWRVDDGKRRSFVPFAARYLVTDKSRLEVSGILSGDEADLKQRMRQKLVQLERGGVGLPGYRVVVHFAALESTYRAICDQWRSDPMDNRLTLGVVHIVEWLRPGDAKTGRELFGEIEPMGIVSSQKFRSVFGARRRAVISSSCCGHSEMSFVRPAAFLFCTSKHMAVRMGSVCRRLRRSTGAISWRS